MKNNYSYLINTVKQWGLDITDNQIVLLDKYYEMLIEKNKVMNLTAITEFDDVLIKHFVDSIAIYQVEKFDKELSVLDLGTGAGFPGIPLAICFPSIKFTLMDSLNKRILFLQDVVDTLGLTNVSCIHSRAEEGSRNKNYRESFDICVSRAVANISTLSEYCLPFVKLGGRFISYKSGDIDTEIMNSGRAIEKLGGNLNKPYLFRLPDTDIDRSFLIIDKVKTTPKVYPRKAGTPSKEPLS